jgi:hypothetical protein
MNSYSKISKFLSNSDEKILWSGKSQTIVDKHFFIQLIPRLFLLAFSITWLYLAYSKEKLLIEMKFVSVFVLLFGFISSFGWYFLLKYKMRKTTYSITSKRLIILSGNDFQSMYLTKVSDLSLSIKNNNNNGTIYFSANNIINKNNTSISRYNDNVIINQSKFKNIENCKNVYHTIESLIPSIK